VGRKGILSEDEGEELVDIPPLGDFKLMNLHVRQQPEQYVSLYFSDPISKSQDLRGLSTWNREKGSGWNAREAS
jgi:hypothetical protein